MEKNKYSKNLNKYEQLYFLIEDYAKEYSKFLEDKDNRTNENRCERYYKKVYDFVKQELDRAREEGKREQAELDRALYSVSFEHIKNADFEKILLESVKKAREEGKLEVLEELLEWDTPLEPIGKFMRLQTKMVHMKRDLLNLLKTKEDEK